MNPLLYIYSYIQSKTGFKTFGHKSVIKFPYKIWNTHYLEIGSNVFIAQNSFFAISTVDKKVKHNPKVKIGNNVCIGSNFFLACIDEIIIENNVLMSDRVFISDHIHGYENIKIPIIDQPLVSKGKVLIKEGAFIGINVVIMPGVTIGKHAIVGASSVVTKDIPAFSVATGNPAKIIKRYNEKLKKWEKVK